jgi:predicted enzyme related to lactoylglutathione lyase
LIGKSSVMKGDMSLSILNVTFDCSDAAATASFWSELTNWPCSKEEMPGNPFLVVGRPAAGAFRLVFVDVVDAKRVKNRIHLDLVPEDASQDQEVDRMLFLGARIIDDRRQATPGGWVVMADPEGNEFCVEGGS